MIISHAHRFIFIKTRKTAGTSIEMALASICGPDDVVTPDHLHATEHDALAANARHYAGRFNPAAELLGARRPIDVARILRDFAVRPRYYNHMRASSVRARTDAATWRAYYKFCFERNPWDKTASFYHWVHRHAPPTQSFETFVLGEDRGTEDQRLPVDWERYAVGDQVIVDEVYDFADLRGGLTRALTQAGVDADTVARLEIPRLKSDVRRRDAPTVHTSRTDAVIRAAFRREIARFEYTPPAPIPV